MSSNLFLEAKEDPDSPTEKEINNLNAYYDKLLNKIIEIVDKPDSKKKEKDKEKEKDLNKLLSTLRKEANDKKKAKEEEIKKEDSNEPFEKEEEDGEKVDKILDYLIKDLFDKNNNTKLDENTKSRFKKMFETKLNDEDNSAITNLLNLKNVDENIKKSIKEEKKKLRGRVGVIAFEKDRILDCLISRLFEVFYKNKLEESLKTRFKTLLLDKDLKEIKDLIQKSIDEKLTSFCYLFYGSHNIEKIDVSFIDANKITNMRHMFSNCDKLKEVRLFKKDSTENVLDMSYMFWKCTNLINLDFEGFNTSSVKDMSSMFNGCRSLKTLYLIRLNTSKVKDMNSMFKDCEQIEEIFFKSTDIIEKIEGLKINKISEINIKDEKEKDNVDNSDKKIKENKDFGKGNKSKKKGEEDKNEENANKKLEDEMKKYNERIQVLIEIENEENKKDSNNQKIFSTKSVYDMSYMFSNCKMLKWLNLYSFDTKNVYNSKNMFENCTSLTYVNISDKFNLSEANYKILEKNILKKLSEEDTE